MTCTRQSVCSAHCSKQLDAQTLHSLAREIVCTVRAFVKRDTERLQTTLRKFGKKTTAATTVSERAARNIISDRRNVQLSEHPLRISAIFRRVRKIAKTDYWLCHVCLSVCPSAWNSHHSLPQYQHVQSAAWLRPKYSECY